MKIFHKFRLKMINRSKVGNYLLYAIGEVVLVVIGILLAIQLNELNNASIQAKERIDLLQNLKGDLQKDMHRLSMLRGAEDRFSKELNLKEAIQNSEIALSLSYENMTPLIADSMLNLSVNAGRPLLNTETSVYDQLKSTGKLYTLGSESLKSKILEYYTRAEREETYNQANNATTKEYELQCAFLSVIEADRMAQKMDFNITNYQWLFNNQSAEMKSYRAYLFQNRNRQQINYNKMGILQEMAAALIETIEKEIVNKRK